MGRMGDLAIEMANEAYAREQEEWIQKELVFTGAEETPEEISRLAYRFDQMYEMRAAQTEADYEWYNSQGYSEFHIAFARSISDTKELLRTNFDPALQTTVCKMAFVHSFTALETYLGDVLKFAVLQDRKYIANAVRNISSLTEKKFKLDQIISHQDFAAKMVFEHLNDILYHDVVKVMEYYKSILGFRISYDLEKISKIALIRHNIVHRNGKDNNGNQTPLDIYVVIAAIAEIENFVQIFDDEIRNGTLLFRHIAR